MFYPSKKQSCMGQAHAARRTAAKLKSVLLRQQLTQINNSQTEDLLGPVLFFFSFWHLLHRPSAPPNPASPQKAKGFTCAAGMLRSQRGHLGKFVSLAGPFWKVLYTCAAVGFLHIKGRLSISYVHMKYV